MKKYRAALLFGGRGLEHEISVKGADYAYGQIAPELFVTLPVLIEKNGVWLISRSGEPIHPSALTEHISTVQVYPVIRNDESGLLTEDGKFIRLDVCFPLLHGDFGEDGTPQGALENAKIPYIGCEAVAGALCCDKLYTKILAESLNIPTAAWIMSDSLKAEDAKAKAEKRLKYPMFIKPARLGSSFGASPVRCPEDFAEAYASALDAGGARILIEELLPVAAELECGYFSANGKELFTKIGKISCNGFYDYESKYIDTSHCDICLDADLEELYGERIREYSRKLVRLIGISGISRFDFFLTEDSRIIFNEINTLPGFTAESLYPRLLLAQGITVREALTELLLEKVEK